ncbi:metalloprotease [Winogradskyella maritima]|uniref:Metalloprotease n=1 Tax=Winogradskyella maritima TaxID=1517766 RepID=A0ABV8ALI5_9FLAO|nr:metalloprotease [Winogradskyella maritima]
MLKAEVNKDSRQIAIQQTIKYKNTSDTTLYEVYLHDWNNSYSNKSTALGKRFEEEFNTSFHLAKDRSRGYTTIHSIADQGGKSMDFIRPKKQVDILKVILNSPLEPGDTYHIELKYLIKLADAQFTDYGFTKEGNFKLKYWYITPAVYNGKWQVYSNKNLDDLFIPASDVSIELTHPSGYKVESEFNQQILASKTDVTTTLLSGKNRTETFVSLNTTKQYSSITTDDFTVLSDIDVKGLASQAKAIITDRVTQYITEALGDYPHKNLLVTAIDYNRDPLYGINQLPDFLRPFPDDIQYELKLLKSALQQYLDNTLLVNPRKDYWLSEGIQIYLMIQYVKTNYPNLKLLGNLANVWGIRAFHASDLDFNFQYFLYSMEMARKNNDQPLNTSKDSLVKFNAKIASKYKAGMGLNYLNDYTEDVDLNSVIKNFVSENRLTSVTPNDFETYLKSQTTKDVDWFFTDYVNTRKKIDFKIYKLKTTEDSISFTIKNKRDHAMPVSLFAMNNDSVLSKTWLDGFKGEKQFAIAKDSIDKLVLDYDYTIPEINQRDNYKSTNGSLFSKPLQFRLFKDIEDPYYNQLFLMPLIEFNNIYDGLTLGTKFYNKTLLRKRLNYRFSPQYATNSKSFTGGGSVSYTHNLEGQNLYDISYGLGVAYQSFAEDAFFTRIRPSFTLAFRDKDDFRSDVRDFINLRYISITRNLGPDATVVVDDPDYSVFNLRYIHSSPGIINFSRFSTDFQIGAQFSKVSVDYEFRKLTKRNRNYDFRVYLGTFLKNSSDPNSDFFSFALDRPTDYLFDLNYLGRSEASGIFSQQIIIAEGGFKSQLQPEFANQWIGTANFSTSIWRYIQAYGDVGFVKNKGFDPVFVYDSGVRLNLVQDYFEIFFPIYSNLGLEIGQENYDQKIRFKFTVDPQVLLGLFRRKWY